MYRLEFSPTAVKNFKKIESRYQKLIAKGLTRLQSIPLLGKPLSGEFKGLFKLRISHFRIVYQIVHKTLIIYIVDIDHRKDIYR